MNPSLQIFIYIFNANTSSEHNKRCLVTHLEFPKPSSCQRGAKDPRATHNNFQNCDEEDDSKATWIVFNGTTGNYRDPKYIWFASLSKKKDLSTPGQPGSFRGWSLKEVRGVITTWRLKFLESRQNAIYANLCLRGRCAQKLLYI